MLKTQTDSNQTTDKIAKKTNTQIATPPALFSPRTSAPTGEDFVMVHHSRQENTQSFVHVKPEDIDQVKTEHEKHHAYAPV